MKDQEFALKIFEATMEGIIVVDELGTIIKSNPACECMFGYQQGGLVGIKVEKLIPVTFRNKHLVYRSAYTKAPKNKSMRRVMDLQGFKKDESQFPVEISLSPTTIDNNEVVIILIIDVTQRILTKNNSQIDENKIIEVQNTSFKESYSWNLRTGDRNASNKIYKTLSEESYSVSKKIDQVTNSVEKKKVEKKAIKNQQELKADTIKLKEKIDKRTHELQVTVHQLLESNINLEDQIRITKAAENKAISSQAMCFAIAENFPKGIITVINNDFEILYCVGEGLRVMNLDKINLKGMKIDEIDIFSLELRAKLKKNIQETLNGKHLSFETNYNNNTFAVNTTPLFDENQKIDRALLVYNDINNQKNIEQEIRKSLQKEHELNELKSRFISTASHEFRTPLSVILSSTTLIEKLNKQGGEEKRKKHLERIKSNVRSLVVILNDFLSISKLEEGKVVARPELFDLIAFSSSIINEIKTNKKNGQIITIIKNTDEVEVCLDPKLMLHILSNLLSNAIKYSPKDKKISLIITKNEKHITLEVVDEGIGIPKNEHKNIFERFFRAKNSVNIQGTGLGLNIVKQNTELMGGTISFKSKLNKGTSFKLELPINIK